MGFTNLLMRRRSKDLQENDAQQQQQQEGLEELQTGEESDMDFLEDSKEERQRRTTLGNEVREWLGFVSKPDISVQIGDEVEKRRKFIVRKKNVFTVRIRKVENGDTVICKRTFREFKRLQATLKERFVGALIPPLPKPNISIGKMIEWLRHFMNEVARNPVFRHDSAFETFCKNDGKKFSDKVVSQLSTHSPGIVHWPQILDTVPLPSKTKEEINTLGKETAKLHAQYTRARDQIRRNQQLMKRQAKDQREISAFYEQWIKVETSELPKLFGRASDPTEELQVEGHAVDMPTILKGMKSISDHRSRFLEDQSDETYEKSFHMIQIELNYIVELEKMVSAVKVAIKRHEAGLAELSNVRNKIDSNIRRSMALSPSPGPQTDAAWPPAAEAESGRQEGASTPPTPPLASPTPANSSLPSLPKSHGNLERKSVSLVQGIRESQTTLKRMIRGLLFEMQRYRFERTARSSQLFNGLASLEVRNYETASEKCSQALEWIPAEVPPVSHLSGVVRFFDEAGASSPQVTLRHPAFDSDEINSSGAALSSNQEQIPSKRTSLRVKYDFEAEEDGEVTLRRGDVVDIIQGGTDEDGWCMVQKGSGEQGLAPVSYLTEMAETDAASDSHTSPPASPRSDASSPVASDLEDREPHAISYHTSAALPQMIESLPKSSATSPFDQESATVSHENKPLLAEIANFNKSELSSTSYML